MVNHSTENSKSNQKQNQISNEEQQSVKMSSEPRNISGTRSGFYDVQSELNRMNANNEGVQVQLSRMNTNLEKMCACFLRMTHDRGKQIDHSSNGDCRGFLELDVEHRERLIDGEMVVPGQIDKLNGVIGSKVGRVELKSFDRMMNQNWCSVPTAMDSGDRDLVITIGNVQYPITEEVLHQIFDSFGSFEIIDLCSLENGVVQAQIRFRCSSSAAWTKLSLQGRSIYDGCCHMKIEFYKQQEGGMNSFVTDFHRVIEKPNIQLSDCEVHRLDNYNEYTVFEENTAEVDTMVVLAAEEVFLVGEEAANSSIVIDCGAANVNEVCVGDANAREVLIETEGILVGAEVNFSAEEPTNATHGIDLGAKTIAFGIEKAAANAIIGTEMSENGVAKNGLLQVLFNDPFYDTIESVLVNDKMYLMLVVRIAIGIAMVESKCWLIVGCEVFMAVMCFQDSAANAIIGAQWLRMGVG